MYVLRVGIQFDPDPGKYSRIVRRARVDAHREGGLHWTREHLPRHFREGAAGRYGYRRRSRRYQRAKRKRGLPPLVLSGTLEAMATGAPNVRGYPTRTTIRLETPHYVPQRPRRPNQPWIAREIFQVTPAEQRDIERIMLRTAEHQIERSGEKRTVTIGG